jgi:F0F1-type ATP synthase membrane subunit b/b'
MIVLAFAENAIQLVPDGTLLIHLLLVIGMVAVLNRTLFRPINKVLEERETETGGRLSEAQRVQKDFESSQLKYERGLRDARSAAYQLIEAERSEALNQREEKITRTKEDIRLWVSNERAEIERQAEEVRNALARESIESAVGIGSQILHRAVNSKPGS